MGMLLTRGVLTAGLIYALKPSTFKGPKGIAVAALLVGSTFGADIVGMIQGQLQEMTNK